MASDKKAIRYLRVKFGDNDFGNPVVFALPYLG